MSENNSAEVKTELNVKPTDELMKSVAEDLKYEDGDLEKVLEDLNKRVTDEEKFNELTKD